MARGFALTATLGCLLSFSSAHAQTPSETAAARELFTEGLAAIAEERWEDARDRFSRSYAIVPRSSTLVNLAHAQVELGRLLEARETYRRFLAEPGRAAPLVPDARVALEDLDPRIAHAVIRVDGIEDSDEVRLDGEAIARAAVGTRLPMNPGPHRVEVVRGGEVVGRASLSLEEGEDAGEVLVPVTARAAPREVDPGPTEAADEDLLTSPWLWVGVGGGALLVVLAVVIGAVAAQPRDPFVGNLGPGMVTF